MGEYAEAQWQSERYRGRRDPFKKSPNGRNPIATTCPHCGKGIRPIQGKTDESVAAHMKAKHPEVKTR